MRLSVIARRRVKRTVPQLVRLACVVALVALAVFAASIFYPKPLVVIFSMSIGHAIGMLAGALYVLAIVLDTVRPASGVEPASISSDGDRVALSEAPAEPADTPPASKR
ncbi:MAG TPA: hypothetical protein VI197_23675 [Polyangiaceae bacterium]